MGSSNVSAALPDLTRFSDCHALPHDAQAMAHLCRPGQRTRCL